jgi:basic amino acid/polyamine antiporter, APA family
MQDLLDDNLNSYSPKNDFEPRLKLLDATMIVAGSMIGSGIFIVSADMLRNLGSAGWLILAWILTGVFTLFAALSYGELSSAFPKAGGQYVYLKEAFGRLTSFLYGWTLFTVIQTGTIAAVGVAFAKFTAYFLPIFELNERNIILSFVFDGKELFNFQYAHLLSIALVILLTYINTRGVEGGKKIQTLFTIAKVGALLALVVFGLLLGFNKEIWNQNWQSGFQLQSLLSENALKPAAALIAAALVGSVFSADAWNNITFIAGEVKNPEKNIGKSLLLGTGIVLLLYVVVNLMYLSVLSLPEIANAPQDRVAIAVCEKLFGPVGTKVMAALIMISTFGCINGMILAGSRVYYTMAQDKLFFPSMAKLNKNKVPENALWVQCLWTCLLCLSGKYGDLLDYVVIAVLIFYVITILGIFRLRKTQPNLPRPYKAFGYPIIPALYCIMAITFSVLLLMYKPNYTLPGIAIVVLGIPVYFIFLNKKR